jgi:hypothetical protein
VVVGGGKRDGRGGCLSGIPAKNSALLLTCCVFMLGRVGTTTIPKEGDVGVRVLFVLVTVLCCAVHLESKCQDRGQSA